MMSSAKTHYEVLNVAPDASHEAIRKSWRILSLKHHPDRHPEPLKDAANNRMQAINVAWHTLSNDERRSKYDARLKYEREERARKAREKADREAAEDRAKAERTHTTENDARAAEEPAPEKPGPQPDTPNRRPSPPPPPPPRAWKPQFLHVVAVCAGIAWLYAAYLAEGLMPLSTSGLPFMMRLFNGALVDLAGTPFVLGLFFACVGWIVGKVLPMTRKKPSWVALASVLAFFFLLWKTLPPEANQMAQNERPAATSSTPHHHAPKKKSSTYDAHASSKERKPPQAAAAMPPEQRQIYDKTVDELERNYPEINPRAPGYQPRLAKKIIERKAQLVEKGMAPEIAVQAATSEILDAARHRDDTPDGQ